MSWGLRSLLHAAAAVVRYGYTGPAPEDIEGDAARSLQTSPCAGPQTVSDLFDTITQSPYDPKSRPNITGAATQVQVQLYLTSITEIDEKLQKVGVSGYFRTWWDDHRLAYNSTSDGGCFDEINIARSEWPRLWRPDIYFDNSLEESYGADMLHVYPSGRIWSSVRLEQHFECAMFFGRLPFDEQKCTILVASYSANARHEYVRPFNDDEGLRLKECYSGTMAWGIRDIRSHLETRWFGEEGSRYPWTYVHLDVFLRRHSMFYIREYLAKGILFVLTSWCGFFISPNNAPARVAMGVIPLLTITTYLQAIYDRLPVISYWTWLTSYLTICMVYSTIPVFEYAFVCYLLRVEERRADKLKALRSLGALSALKTSAVFEEEAVDDIRSRRSRSSRFAAIPSRWPRVLPRWSESKVEVMEMPPQAPMPRQHGGTDSAAANRVSSVPSLDVVEELRPASHDDGPHAQGGPPDALEASSPCGAPPPRNFEETGSVCSKPKFAGIRLTPLQHAMVQEAWANIDSERSGDISIKELRQGLRNFGQFFTLPQTTEMFHKLGMDEHQGMNKRKFLEFLANYDDIAPTNVLCKSLFDQPPSRQVDTVVRVLFLVTFFLWTLCWCFTVSNFNDYNSEGNAGCA